MKITIARYAGFCFGVRRAIDITFKVRQKNPHKKIYTLGQIIHNPQVIEALKRRGIGIVHDTDDERLKAGDIAIVRAHGIAPDKKQALEEKGIEVIDAACPMVLKVQAIIKKASRSADLVVIVGDKNHPEMDAHLGIAGNKGVAVEDVQDAKNLPRSNRVAVVAQTTFDVAIYKDIIAVLRDKCEVLDIADTICRSTVDRQSEVRDLAKDHDFFIVIGGRDSANTKRLAEIAAKEGREVIRVEDPDQLRIANLPQESKVAVIAGASTPHWVIEECIEALKSTHTHAGIENAVLNLLAATPLLPSLGSLGVAMAALVFCGRDYAWEVLLTVFFLASASTGPHRTARQWPLWAVSTGIATSLGLLSAGLTGGLLVIGVSLLRPLIDVGGVKDYLRSVYGLIVFVLISIFTPLSLMSSSISPGVFILVAYVATHYLGIEILLGLKNMERDAIIGRMSLARYIHEEYSIMALEYAIMGLALVLFLSFPLKIAPALAYGLLPPLFFLAKGIDFYHDQVIFDNRMYTIYVQSLWVILPAMGLLWKFTMM
ncbi:MAG TPA: 4-hydroxy-3-methylbut-2-enyl diphosphate reductase [Deltaproteobacteria bacterium]|jgi:4-hydroxy-3-methylbut-2-enyl diphosphate reductase|nr:4-hydroxy-3-methylbut-2-enyl diphosphate reductase [Deltaproteobacteria bacterium]HOE73336.1 4-hydroxy-3-methylbut-2-enyl diphosphate reductase [Deltaproteobacteria bacterium]HPL87453.1 4-hydroxy-3-methylbut-2-enyl diphosphate reductase [Deltaproteobacteria bacterium]HPV29215.1 4-hydroxy-3-methylbut-2-enyl diphosphate reductase [Deltaproteobacteria bacterium]HQM20038.1 4-hydroxy-3-methylbut-2-enyl diphosphate reductase [Deltaproteobacteria bacterium]